jgi:hypothetical protein
MVTMTFWREVTLIPGVIHSNYRKLAEAVISVKSEERGRPDLLRVTWKASMDWL